MNNTPVAGAIRSEQIVIDPLVSQRGEAAQLADLAFGNLSRDVESLAGRHLALLPAETLELDLSDPDQRQFGDYELLELIGEGGMGMVYRARQLSLDREVAVKLLAAGPWASKEFIERFRREAQNAARMQHPNIVAIYEVGSAEELHFFSMRLVRGSNLAAEIRREGKLPALRAAAFLRTIAEAVEYAHCLGVLHLDLKPANVLLDENGTPHVADFGLARRLEQGLAADNDEVSGTPSYMAPEQATLRSQKITPATDIWGLGAILYELVTGQPPFLGESAQATLTLVLESELRSPRQLTPGLPRDLEAIILKCMARDVGERYVTARALADDLTRFIENRPVRARPLSAPQRILRWSRRQPYLAALAALFTLSLIVGIAGVTSQWRRAENNAQLASQRLHQARIDQAAIAMRDGHSYDALPGLANNIQEREAQGLDAREDRIRIATVERSAPRLIDAMAIGSSIFGVALSPDARQVAVATLDQNLRLIDTQSGKELWQTSFKDSTHFMRDPGDPIRLVLLRFSADGRFLIGRNHPGLPTAVTPTGYNELLFDVASGKLLTPPMSIVPNFRDATYSPDGAFAVVRSTDRRAVLMRTADWQTLGRAYSFDQSDPVWLVTAGAHHVLTLDVGFVDLSLRDPATNTVRHVLNYPASRRVTAWASSPDGESVVLGHLDGQVERLDCASGRSQVVSASPVGRVGWVTFSPDGAWFGAVADSGEILVWDTSTLKLAAPLMHLNVTPENHRDQLMIDAVARTVMASSDYEMALWYLPDAISAPVRLTGEFPRYANAWWLRAFGYDPASGLVATDAGQGELRLWRTQQLAPRGLRGPPLPPETLNADAGHILAVDGNSVQLRNAADVRAVGAKLELPQAVSFAQLTADGASLVVTAGREIFVYDSSKWTLRRAPIALPNDPARMLLSPDSRHALVLVADHDNGINRELGQIWDLVEGTPSSPLVAYPSYARFRFAPDGRSLVYWMLERLQMSDAMTLAPRWKVALGARGAGSGGDSSDPSDPDRIITDAQISTDGTHVDVLTADIDSLGDVNREGLFWWLDATTGTQVKRIVISETGGGSSFALMPDQHHAIIQRSDLGPLWWDESKGTKVLPDASSTEYGALSLAHDASMFARAAGMNLVIVTSTSDLNWLSPPLPTSLPTEHQVIEFPTHLAITRDGSGVVGRNRSGQWLYWNIEPDKRPIAQIQSEAALLNPVQAAVKDGLSPPLPAADRASLRADDAGAPVHVGGISPSTIPPRRTALAANLFDLSVFYNQPLQTVSRLYYFSFAELAPGVHRFLDVDYDVRGFIQTSMPGYALKIDPERPPPQFVSGIHPGIEKFSALNVLFAQHTWLERPELRAMAIVQLDYRDGSHERLPIQCVGADCSAWFPEADMLDETAPPVAWRSTDAAIPWSVWHATKIYAVHLKNPHPEREVKNLALEAVDEPWSAPMFFAISAEPVDSTVSPGMQ
jgi:serine/threonine protein kinase